MHFFLGRTVRWRRRRRGKVAVHLAWETAGMPWKFTKPTAGKIAVTLDNNVWNLLFEKGIDLTLELSPKEFAVFITRKLR
jgi:hypothetical protein